MVPRRPGTTSVPLPLNALNLLFFRLTGSARHAGSGIHPTEHRLLVSKRIKEEFENGKDYYRLEGQALRLAQDSWAQPSTENLD